MMAQFYCAIAQGNKNFKQQHFANSSALWDVFLH